MHIAQVFDGIVPPAGYGGIERVVQWLVGALSRMGHTITLIADPRSGLPRSMPQIHFLDYGDLAGKSGRALQHVDIFHFHNGVPAEWQNRRPYLVTEHGNNKRKHHYDRNTVFLSRSHARNHNAEFFLPNGIPLDDYPLRRSKSLELAFMARLNWRAKNARTAINLAFDSRTPIHLTGGFLRQSRKAWGSWCLRYPFMKSLIHEHGDVDGADKLDILGNSMCLFYIVNWHEPFALAPHEALACGTPVLAAPNGALAEYIRDGENGFLVESYDEALDAIRQLKHLDDRDRGALSDRCRASAYRIEDCVQRHLEMYETILAQGYLYSEREAADIGFRPPPAIKVVK